MLSDNELKGVTLPGCKVTVYPMDMPATESQSILLPARLITSHPSISANLN